MRCQRKRRMHTNQKHVSKWQWGNRWRIHFFVRIHVRSLIASGKWHCVIGYSSTALRRIAGRHIQGSNKQGWTLENEGTKILRNVSNHLANAATSLPERLERSANLKSALMFVWISVTICCLHNRHSGSPRPALNFYHRQISSATERVRGGWGAKAPQNLHCLRLCEIHAKCTTDRNERVRSNAFKLCFQVCTAPGQQSLCS
jgi:hypothetical protein